MLSAGISRLVASAPFVPEPVHFAGLWGIVLFIVLIILFTNASAQARRIETLEVRLDMVIALYLGARPK